MSSSLHEEIEFENDICAYLATNGWLYAEGDADSKECFSGSPDLSEELLNAIVDAFAVNETMSKQADECGCHGEDACKSVKPG